MWPGSLLPNKKTERNGPPTNGRGTLPNARDMIMFCVKRVNDLSEKDQKFIRGIHEQRIWRWPISQARQEWLEDVYLRLGGTI